MRTFFQELKRRRVYRLVIGYVIGASALIQLCGTVFPAFHAPDWAMQFFLILVALGFPIALVFGWLFDVTPTGVHRTETSNARTDRRRLVALVLTGLLVAGMAVAAYSLWHPRRAALAPPRFDTGTIPEKSVAVLPFDNLSDDDENAHFAEGVHDEILTKLAKASDLKVISRTSTMQYGSARKRNLRDIGKELGAAHIVEGTVQRAGNRVRLSAQLIDARTDAHLWAEHYDRDLANVFALESDLAETIVAQLRSRLSAEEKAAIETPSTADTEAHDLYLRANALISGPLYNVEGTENLFKAADLLEKAVARDPNYFLAYCLLARTHDQIYLTGPDHTPARLALADAALQAAQRLQPDAGETHLARAEHLYCGQLAYDEARRELAKARAVLPNESLTFELAGYIDRRENRWDESNQNLAYALELDPRNAYLLQQLAVSFQLLRRYDAAADLLGRALQVRPNDNGLRVARAGIELHARAETEPLHRTIAEIVRANPEAASGLADEWLYLALCEKDSAAAEQAIAVMSEQGYNNEGVVFSRPWCRALAARARGDTAAAQSAFLAARAEVEQTLREQPEQSQALCVLGMIEAALGQKDEALRAGRRAVELLPLGKDAINGPLAIEYLAVTYAWTGEVDQAIAQLREAAAIPGDVSYGQLRLHPFWDTLRADPRFEEIVVGLAPPAAPRR